MSIIQQTYKLGDRIASGRFGSVYRATHVTKNTNHAVKRLMLKRQDLETKKNEALLKAEVNNWQSVNNKSGFILPLENVIYDTHEGDAVCFLVSPLCQGGNLRTAALKLPFDQKLRMARQLAMAVSACHENNLLHGDIKPDNVLVHYSRIQLCDFGSSVRCEKFTEGGYVSWMTLNYAPPEAMDASAGKTGLGQAADMWAVGVTLYELMHDMEAMPFDNRKKLPDGMRVGLPKNDPIQQKNIYWPANTRHTIANPKTHKLCDVIIACLDRDPENRLTAREVLQALQ